MADVLFKKGLQANYESLGTKVPTTFYYTTDEKNLYIGDVKLSNDADLKAALSRISANEKDLASLKDVIAKLNGDESVDGSVKKQINDAVTTLNLKAIASSGKAKDVALDDAAGNFTTDNVESALADLAGKINSTGEAGSLSIETASTEDAAAAGYAAIYIFKQGTKEVGRINIAKDMVATSGEIVYPTANAPITVDGASVTSGTYIKLVIANNNTPVYINVADLIEYNAVDNAEGAEVILSESEDHKISATLAHIAGSKIDDGTVAKTKLDAGVQASLEKANSALQAADKTELANATKKAQDTANAAQTDANALKEVVGKAADTESGTVATGIFEKIDSAVAAQATKDASQDSKIEALERAVGEGGSVDSQIDTRIKALDTTADVATAVVDANDATKVGIYGVKEIDGIISQGEKITEVASAASVSTVKTALIGTDEDTADKDTIKGSKKYADNVVNTALTWNEF